MDDDKPIEIKVEPKPQRMVTFRIGDEDYEFRVPKTHSLTRAVRGMQADAGGAAEIQIYHHIEDWLFEACTEAERLTARLDDHADSLDTEHIVQIFQALIKESSARPSGSRRSA